MAIGGSGGGGGAGTGGIRAGRAFVEFSARDAGLRSALDGIKRRMSSFASGLTLVGGGMLAAGGAVLAPLTALFTGGLEKVNQLKDLQDAYSLTAEAVSKLGFAASVAGLEVEDLDTMLFKLAQKNTTGQSLDEFFLGTVDALNAIEDPSQRAAAAFDLLGKGGKKILPVLGDIKGRLGEAPLISQQTLDNAETFNQEVAKLGFVLQAGLAPIVQVLVPVIRSIAEFARRNASLLVYVAAGAAALTALGAAFVGVGLAIKAALVTLGAVVGVVTFLATPIGVVVAAMTALVAAFVAVSGVGKALLDTIGGIVDALAAGDLELAGRVGMAGLRLAFAAGVDFLTELWADFVRAFGEAWASAVYLFKTAWADAGETVGKGFTGLLVHLKENYSSFFAWLFNQWANLEDALGNTAVAEGLRTFATGSAGDFAAAMRGVDRELSADAQRRRNEAAAEFDAEKERLAARFKDRTEQAAADKAAAEQALKNLMLGAAIRRSFSGGGAGGGGAPPGLGQQMEAATRGGFVNFGSLSSVFGAGAGGPLVAELKKSNRLTEEQTEVLNKVLVAVENIPVPTWG